MSTNARIMTLVEQYQAGIAALDEATLAMEQPIPRGVVDYYRRAVEQHERVTAHATIAAAHFAAVTAYQSMDGVTLANLLGTV